MTSMLNVNPKYETAGFGLANLDETESSGYANDSIFATVLTVSPVDTRGLTSITFVDHIPKGALVFTRNLTKTCLEDDIYNDVQPQWPEQRSLSWDRPEHLKHMKIEFSPADYLEAGTIDQINFHFFELSKVKVFTPEDLNRLYARWRLAGISHTNDIVTDEYDGSERMLNLQVAGRAVISNYFEGPVSPNKHRHLFVALKFIQLDDVSDTLEFNLTNNEIGNVKCRNTRPPQADRFAKSQDLFPDDDDFCKRLIPQLFFATSFKEKWKFPDVKLYSIGTVLLNNSVDQGNEDLYPCTINSTSEVGSIKRDASIHVNLKLF